MPAKKDINQTAFSIMQQATGEVPKQVKQKQTAAQESGRRGGHIGGAKRAANLTPEQRSEIAEKAAAARWG